MNKRLFFVWPLLLGFVIFGCKNNNRADRNSVQTTDAVIEKNIVVEKQKANSMASVFAKPEIPVLCYHRIADGTKGDYTVSKATFNAHMKMLADSGYHSVLPEQLYDYLVYNKVLPKKPFMITFDDSRVEHYETAAPTMEKYGFRAAFFIMTITYNKKNYMTKEQIAKLSKTGHTIGMHSWDHTMATKYTDESDWNKQVVDPKKKLESIVGCPVEYWAYPNGVYNHKAAQELSKHFKLSFILASKRDSIVPLQTVRRMIVPEWTAQGLLKSMRRTFN